MKKRILIIEDDRALHQFLAGAMNHETYELVWTQTAHEAFRQSLEKHFDLVLLDFTVPDMDAWQVLDSFSALYPLRPVVMLTEPPDQSQRAEILGADAVLEKPFEQTCLLRTVRRLLGEPPQARRSRLVDSLYGWLRVSP